MPLFLVSAALGLMLAFASARTTLYGLLAFAAASLFGLVAPVRLSGDALFAGLLVSVIATAVLVYLPVRRWRAVILPLCINDGLWLGASASLALNRPALALGLGLLPILVVLPAHWLVRIKFDTLIKVVASWMIAVASLSMFVSLMPTPGYKPDHME